MEHMEERAQNQIEASMNEREECYKRIEELENLIKRALGISELWRPESMEIKDINPEHVEEVKALESMYQQFKDAVKQ